MTRTSTTCLGLILACLLAACGGGSSGGGSTTSSGGTASGNTTGAGSSGGSGSGSGSGGGTSQGTTGTVQGTITGLSASGLGLALNNTTATASPATGSTAYSFATTLAAGQPYTVTITTQPAGLTCQLTNSSGLVSGSGATNVPVACVPAGTANSDHNVVLGSPTASSVVASILATPGASVQIEYGLASAASGKYSWQSATATSLPVQGPNAVATVTLTGLSPNTRYFYRINVREPGATTATPGNEHSFWTQRAAGSTFTFAVQGDSHPERYNNKMFHAELYRLTMQEVAKRQPDLYFMLGDDFSIEAPIQNFKDAYCLQFSLSCGTKVANPTYFFSQAVEGNLNPSSLSLYNSLLSPFIQARIGENVNGLQGYTPLDPKTAGYGTYLEQRLKYLNLMAHSSALFLVNGNHEQAHLANLGGIFNNAAVWAADARNKFYANPTPTTSGFYTGDTDVSFGAGKNGFPGVGGDGLLRDYYAFTWGDALFIVLDPYWHSPFSPDSNLFDAVSTQNEPVAQQTLGDAQYAWLKKTLEGSKAKYKFVFQHHLLGGGRGAASMVTMTEWGGATRTGFNFATDRAGWAKPIHQLLVDTRTPGGQTIVFQGHDHVYSREMVDGIVYQAVPNPGDNSYWAYNCSAYSPASVATFPTTWKKADGTAYGTYDPNYSIVRPDSGFLQVTVSPDSLRVDYIRTYRSTDLLLDANASISGSLQGHVNGETDFSYSLPANPTLDSSVAAFRYACKGDAPPSNFIYNP